MTPALARFAAPLRAYVGGVPERFDQALQASPAPIDVERARAQHAAYVAALEAAGLQVDWIPADEAHPDCCFIEDTAVVLGGRRFLTCPGAPSRRGEVEGVARVLGGTHLDGHLDGGDVLRVGPWLFVGESERTDAAGARALAEACGLELVGVPVGALHLKTVVSGLDGETVLAAPGVEAAVFESRGIRCLRTPEPEGGNLLSLGSTILVSAAAPRTAELLARSREVRSLELDEFHRADGGLSCLSLRIPAAGAWCY